MDVEIELREIPNIVMIRFCPELKQAMLDAKYYSNGRTVIRLNPEQVRFPSSFHNIYCNDNFLLLYFESGYEIQIKINKFIAYGLLKCDEMGIPVPDCKIIVYECRISWVGNKKMDIVVYGTSGNYDESYSDRSLGIETIYDTSFLRACGIKPS